VNECLTRPGRLHQGAHPGPVLVASWLEGQEVPDGVYAESLQMMDTPGPDPGKGSRGVPQFVEEHRRGQIGI
jgi:hypothetical protein